MGCGASKKEDAVSVDLNRKDVVPEKETKSTKMVNGKQ